MIRIDRPAPAPAALAGGARLVADKIAKYEDAPDLYATYKGKFVFDADVYGEAEVREQLKKAQRWKCCFCESRIESTSYGEIEHFRPKAAWRETRKSKLTRPGYYWLAYDWDNLLWSCKVCNGKHKLHLFPLEDPGVRNCPGRSILGEVPLLVDPTTTDPREHIRFKFDKAIHVTEAGHRTIEALGLNRQPLVEERHDRMNHLIAVWENVEMARETGRTSKVVDGQRTLDHAVLPHSPFSSMAIDLIKRLRTTTTAHAA